MTDYPQDQPAEGEQRYSGQPPPPPQPSQTPPPPPPPGQAPTYSGGQAYGQQAPVSPSDARLWATLANILGIFFSFIAPLVVYLIYKDRDPFIRRHSTQALNFQIFVLIGYIASGILSIVIIGIFTGLAVFICSIVFPILASIAANKGEEYTYPYIPQLVT